MDAEGKKMRLAREMSYAYSGPPPSEVFSGFKDVASDYFSSALSGDMAKRFLADALISGYQISRGENAPNMPISVQVSPVVGDAYDAAEAIKYAAKGDLKSAFMSGVGLIPFMVGIKPKTADEIKEGAESLAKRLRDDGFEVSVDHSGSAAGASSYVTVYDPKTGRYIKNPARFSGHSKGAHQSQFVHDMLGDDEVERFIKLAKDMREMGPSKLMMKAMEKQNGVVK